MQCMAMAIHISTPKCRDKHREKEKGYRSKDRSRDDKARRLSEEAGAEVKQREPSDRGYSQLHDLPCKNGHLVVTYPRSGWMSRHTGSDYSVCQADSHLPLHMCHSCLGQALNALQA